MTINRRTVLASGLGLAAAGLVATEARASASQAADVPADAIILVAEIKAKEGEEDSVKKALLAMVAPTAQGTGLPLLQSASVRQGRNGFSFLRTVEESGGLRRARKDRPHEGDAGRHPGTHRKSGSHVPEARRVTSGQSPQLGDASRGYPLGHEDVSVGVETGVVGVHEPTRLPLRLVAADGELGVATDSL